MNYYHGDVLLVTEKPLLVQDGVVAVEALDVRGRWITLYLATESMVCSLNLCGAGRVARLVVESPSATVSEAFPAEIARLLSPASVNMCLSNTLMNLSSHRADLILLWAIKRLHSSLCLTSSESFKFSHSRMASHTGLSIKTIGRTLRKLEHQQVIEVSDNHFIKLL